MKWTIVGASPSTLSHMTYCANAVMTDVEISTARVMCLIIALQERRGSQVVTTISSFQLRDGSDEWKSIEDKQCQVRIFRQVR